MNRTASRETASVFVSVCAFILMAQENTTVTQTFKMKRKVNQSPTALTTNFSYLPPERCQPFLPLHEPPENSLQVPRGLRQRVLTRVKPQSQQSRAAAAFGLHPVDMELMICQASHHTRDSVRRGMQEQSKVREKLLG